MNSGRGRRTNGIEFIDRGRMWKGRREISREGHGQEDDHQTGTAHQLGCLSQSRRGSRSTATTASSDARGEGEGGVPVKSRWFSQIYGGRGVRSAR